MAARNSSPIITGLAILAAFVVGGVLAVNIFSSRQSPSPALPGPPPAATPAPPAPTPAAAATPTPAPTATPEPTPAPKAAIRGVVKNADGSPRPGAEIYLVAKGSEPFEQAVRDAYAAGSGFAVAKSDAAGAFAFDAAPGRIHVVGLVIEGEPQAIAQELAAAPAGGTVEAELAFPRAYQVRGSVVDESAAAVPNVPLTATIQMATLRGAGVGRIERAFSADAQGNFSLDVLEPTRVSLAVDRAKLSPEFLWRREPAEILRDAFGPERAFRIDFDLERTVAVAGVVAGDGKPAAGAAVKITPLSATGQYAGGKLSATVDAQGRFRFDHQPAGLYLIEASHADFGPGTLRDFDPRGGGEAIVALATQSAFSGWAAVEPGAPQGAEIKLGVLSHAGLVSGTAAVGADGRAPFRFDRLTPGAYVLIAEWGSGDALHYAEADFAIAAGEPVRLDAITLRPMRTAAGRIVGDAAGVRIRVQPLGPPGELAALENPARRRPVPELRPDGTFTVSQLRAGTDYLIIAEDARTGRILAGGEAPAEGAARLSLTLGGTGAIAGRLLNALGEACSGETVELEAGLGSLDGAAADIQRRTTRTDFRGDYRFDAVPAGQARIFLRDETDRARLLTVIPDTVHSVDFPCRSYVEVTLEIASAKPLDPREQLLILPQPGTEAKQVVREITPANLKLRLEPGAYSITRTATMESRRFEVTLRNDGVVKVAFEQ